jgi:hypothetical protein
MKPHCCQELSQNLSKRESALVFIGKFREYGIRVLDGGTSFIQIRFCPWCGQTLPSSLRDEWFSQIEALNLEPDDPKIPPKFRTGAWWEKQS